MGKAARLKRERREAQVIKQPAWTPFERIETVSPDLGNGVSLPVSATGFQRCYRNSRYQVLYRDMGGSHNIFGRGIHLSIKRLDRLPIHDWRDLQRIKNEIVGKETEAVEIYPKDSRLVDAANQFHLWCFPEYTFPFGFGERMVRDENNTLFGAVQRPFEESTELTSDYNMGKLYDKK